MNDDGPRRLLDEAPDDALGGLLEALQVAREALPREAQLEALAARLPLDVGPAPDGGEGEALAPEPIAHGAPLGAALKIAAAALVVMSGGLLWLEAQPPREAATLATRVDGDVAPEVTSPAQPSRPVIEASPTPSPEPDARVKPPKPKPSPRLKRSRRRAAPKPAPSKPAPPSLDPAEELRLLQRAQAALARAPAEALRLTERHRVGFPSTSLGQEREVISVEALSRLGRVDEARVRAQRFQRRWPRSSHLPRLKRLIGGW